jgi:tRNA(Ile)-lysidine synthase
VAARPDLRPVLAYVAHGLRGGDLDRDEAALVAGLADRLGADHVLLPVSVVRTGGGPEDDARVVRHAALAAEAERRGAAAVLYGHHAEDQAATLLLRLARGTGPHGLAGMVAATGDRPPRLRPLLRLRRADLARVCVEEGVRVATDPTNVDRDLRRVRAEEEALPALARIGPDPVGALGRLAALVRADEVLLADLAAGAAAALPVRRVGPAVALPSAALRALPAALARRILRVELGRLGGAGTAATVARVLDAPDATRVTLPGPLRLEVAGGWHLLVREDLSAPPPVPLVVPGVAAWPAAGLTLTAAPGPWGGAATGAGPGAGTAGAVLPGLLPGLHPGRLAVGLRTSGPFVVRARRAGDRVRTPGGTRRLGDVLAAAGVPSALRELVPVVAEAAAPDRPVWVPGVVVAEELRAGGDAARSVLRADVTPPHPDPVGSDG